MSDIVKLLRSRPMTLVEARAVAEIERLRSPDPIREEMVRALEITRMQVRVNMAGKIALTAEKHLSIVEAALSKHRDHNG